MNLGMLKYCHGFRFAVGEDLPEGIPEGTSSRVRILARALRTVHNSQERKVGLPNRPGTTVVQRCKLYFSFLKSIRFYQAIEVIQIINIIIFQPDNRVDSL